MPTLTWLFLCACGSGGGGDDDGADGDSDTDSDTGPDCDIEGDRDLDGHDSLACGGDDCDDGDPAILPGASDPNAVWSIEVVDPIARSPGGADVAVAADGTVHVVYADSSEGVVFHADRAGAVWSVETVEEAMGR